MFERLNLITEQKDKITDDNFIQKLTEINYPSEQEQFLIELNSLLKKKYSRRCSWKITDTICNEICEEIFEDWKESKNVIIIIFDKSRNYDQLNMFSNREQLLEQLENDKDYEVFYLNVYDHSGQYFSISKNEAAGWDNKTIGYIALKKSYPFLSTGVQEQLNKIWNGDYHLLQLSNIYTGDVKESEIISDFEERDSFISSWKEKYGKDILVEEEY